MTSFYDDKVHALELAEELSQVNCQDDLEFAYLFEYEPPSSDDFSAEKRGLLCLFRLNEEKYPTVFSSLLCS